MIYKARQPVPASDAAPGVDITSLAHGETAVLGTNTWDSHQVLDRVEVAAELDAPAFAEVTAAQVGDGDYVPIGTDDSPPYRVFWDAGEVVDQRQAPGCRSGPSSTTCPATWPPTRWWAWASRWPSPPRPPATRWSTTSGPPATTATTPRAAPPTSGACTCGATPSPPARRPTGPPQPFLGEDEYGRFAFIELANDTAPVNFIVHRGDTKDPADSPDRSFDPAATPEIWLREGDLTVYTSQAEALGHATVHYACTDCPAVTLNGAAPEAFDDYGAVFTPGAGDLAAP